MHAEAFHEAWHRRQVHLQPVTLPQRAEFGRLGGALGPQPTPVTVAALRVRVGGIAAQRGQADPVEPGADDIGDPFGAPLTVARMRAAEVAAAVDLVIGALGRQRAQALGSGS